MRARPEVHGPTILKAFFDATKRAVSCLRDEPGFEYEEVVTEYGGSTPIRIEDAGWIFAAKAVFRTSRIEGKIVFGDYELLVDCTVGRKPHEFWTGQYGLWAWSGALGVRDSRASTADYVTTAEQVTSIVDGFGAVLSMIWPQISAADQALIDRVKAITEKQNRISEELLRVEIERRLSQPD